MFPELRAESDPVRVLIACRQPSIQALMAAAWFQSLGKERLLVTSASPEPEAEHALLSPELMQVLAERQLDLPDHACTRLSEIRGSSFDLVIFIWISTPDQEVKPHVRLSSIATTAWTPGGCQALLAGDPVHLVWPVPPLPLAPAGTEEQRAGLQRVRDELELAARALLGLGCIDALLQQRYRTKRYMDVLSEGLVAHDGSRCICQFNSAAEQITGFAREEVLGRDCHQVFPPDGLCGSECSFLQEPAGELAPRRYEIGFTTKGGVDKRLRMMVHPMDLGASAGRHPGVVAVIHDVTEVSELRWLVQGHRGFRGMVGASEAMQEVFQVVRQVSASDYSVLISGESGTGKELVARAIHAESRRSRGPFIPINCGALPENILESELFGHVKGAFTGAIRDKKGRFELAHRGTLFLDEVGELTPAFQVKLLRVLQDQRIEPVGGERSINVDVRIISATNRDLRRMVQQGRFREDLYYRLCVVPLSMPPLRERKQDLPLLVEHILAGIRKETGRPGLTVSAQAMPCLLRHPWPGNVRELINVLQYASVRCQEDEILAQHLPPETCRPAVALAEAPNTAAGQEPVPALDPVTAPGPPPGPAPDPHLQTGELPATLRRGQGSRFKLDESAVRQAMARSGGNKVKAARLLGVGRATLYRFLERNTED